MTNFQIAAERDLPLNDGQARIIVHFLSFVGVIPFVQHTGSEGIRDRFARVAQVLFGSNYVTKVSPSFAIACSESTSELARLCPGSGICNSFTNRFFPRHITTQDVRSGLFGDLISTSSPRLPRSCTNLGSVRGNEFSAFWGEISKTIVHVANGLIAHTSFYPVPERDEFGNFRKLTVSNRDSKF